MSSQFPASDARVLDLTESYGSLEDVNTLVADLLRRPETERAFRQALKHEYFVVRRRSQDFADNEITVPQAAFAYLYEMDTNSHAAMALFVDEILGATITPLADEYAMATAVLGTRSALLNRMFGPVRDLASASLFLK